MSIFVYAECAEGTYKKSALEAVSYAKTVADLAGTDVIAISVNATDSSEKLYTYGATKVLKITNDSLKSFSAKAYAEALSSLFTGDIFVFPGSNEGLSLAPYFAGKVGAALHTNVLAAPTQLSPFTVERKAFSGKGIMTAQSNSDKTVVAISQNAYGLKDNPVQGSEEAASVSVSGNDVQVLSHEVKSGTLDLKDAEIVVSAGRGMKGPENWGMIEDLAQLLGAATACSKPVSDIGWRPHSEHVGQTGKAIAPKLYIAVGISGAIQHLAGVNGSKTIVVVNNDPEAPFFKSADYGVVGDALQVIPQLTEKIKALKG